ncbi:MAG TPA: hypothetical protein VHC70_04650 [Phycisphaerales bacterium]|jgi:hypothetical protein|nr:hypothetical protein [Phycisphaerales bacterium]
MSTSQRTFDQVKNILGKLDRNIDAARARRMQAPANGASAPSNGGPIPISSAQPANPPTRPTFMPSGSLTPMPTFGSSAPARSVYGRATPMRSDQRNQQTGT